ncbi:type I restriction-modification system subunit M [Polluticoccus soli]|uniref:type I restriction-modification system subunit M n=1 Tax=Polluticoccus soli TaxID=3034150 RepID=UPI0023E112EB|nr:class I SAM-dependent DNA methyltransferase [Flavipsychrobacter sp. JY13-12]
MTGQQLAALEKKLWEAADQLRANSKLTATEYSFPVLGLIFLRHAYNRFITAKAEIEKTLPRHPQRGIRTLTKHDFENARALYLPEKARWDYLAHLPEGADIGEALDEAMRQVEYEYEALNGVLPKNYILFEKDLMTEVVRIFNTEELDDVTGDVFGRIYEYFLNEFAKKGAQEGGEFFTPPSLVNAIVAIIEPDHGTVFDPACGSGGMFVQTGHFLESEGLDPAKKVTFYGQEKTDTNTRLAKMNMAVHGLDAKIVQGNSFYEDHHSLMSSCDFVMANPPFNVDGVDKSKKAVKEDKRLPFGLPKNDNANYLWIQYFYAYLNEAGRAGFVMASSASDAGHTEKAIREELVKTGAVDVMVSIGTKFFYTRSLPCNLWFFDRAKEKDKERRDRTLMLDLRDVYRKVSSSLHDFTDEQLQNIKAIVHLYRGEKKYFKQLVADYKEQIEIGLQEAIDATTRLQAHKLKTEKLSVIFDKPAFKPEALKKTKRNMAASFKQLEAEAKTLLQSDEVKKDRQRRNATKDYLDEAYTIWSELAEGLDHATYFHKEYTWLMSRFPNGEYNDVPGLCKVVSRKTIAANDYSLTAGRYVGVASVIDEDFDYEERMGEIKYELQSLNAEAVKLEKVLNQKFEELGI